MPIVQLPLATVDYRVFGPDESAPPAGPTAVFVHGLLVNGTLWDPVAELLAAAGVRCIVPDWPLGSHRLPVPSDRSLTPETVAGAVHDFLDALDLREVVLVGNDSGGAICQLVVKSSLPSEAKGGADRGQGRIGGLVLTNCDAFETFPPPFFAPLFLMARFRPAVWALAQATRLRAVRHSPLAFGALLRRPRSASLTRGWMQPAIDDSAIRADLARFVRGVKGGELLDARDWLSRFDRPTRIVWGMRDWNFTPTLGRRLHAAFPTAVMIEEAEATTFIPIDRPEIVSEAILSVAGEIASRVAP